MVRLFPLEKSQFTAWKIAIHSVFSDVFTAPSATYSPPSCPCPRPPTCTARSAPSAPPARAAPCRCRVAGPGNPAPNSCKISRQSLMQNAWDIYDLSLFWDDHLTNNHVWWPLESSPYVKSWCCVGLCPFTSSEKTIDIKRVFCATVPQFLTWNSPTFG